MRSLPRGEPGYESDDSGYYQEPEVFTHFRQRHGIISRLFPNLPHSVHDVQYLPCYGCLVMRKTTDIDSVQIDKLRLNPRVQTSRRCLTCVMTSPVFLDRGTPWLKYGGGKYVILCRKCKRTETSTNVNFYKGSVYNGQQPNQRMRADMLCTACWEEESQEWVKFKKALQKEMQERQRFLRWMIRVDDYGVAIAGEQSTCDFTPRIRSELGSLRPRLFGLQSPGEAPTAGTQGPYEAAPCEDANHSSLRALRGIRIA